MYINLIGVLESILILSFLEVDLKRLSLFVAADTHKLLKLYAVHEGLTMSEVVNLAIIEYLKRQEKDNRT